ncbi:putative receptor-like protein kinase At4g00960 [Prunus persica]|uniref:putative receptor-like protein kinase At4g00960 n=1 Tax=Prunus persica TaxID=3760 RepID=UPI0009AB878A|nr:putative receptor-like protein kinase At4g00960 [Prunus persica]
MLSSTFRLLILWTLFALPIIININITQARIQPPGIPATFCVSSRGNYTTNSTYQQNLNDLLSSLLSNSNGYGFYNSSRGQNSEIVYAIGLCRGDAKSDVCGKCLSDAAYVLPEACPNQKEAIGFYRRCMLRYSNRSMFGLVEVNPAFSVRKVKNVSSTNLDAFNREVSALLNGLTREAAGRGDILKFAVGNANVSANSNVTIYGLAQCTPELSEIECTNCFNVSLGAIRTCCSGSMGARVSTPSCTIRYESHPFFHSTTQIPWPLATPASASPPPPPANHTVPRGKKSNTSRTVIITVVVLVVSLFLITSICIYLRVKKRRETLEEGDEIRSAEALQFDFNSIRIATNNFCEGNKLGRGGFGAVYRGRLLNEEDIAVKRLSRDSAQGDIEFRNEVELVAKLQHRNLVRLLGFCLEGNERLLVYEFVHNASLDQFIFDPIKRAQLDWDRRYKIIVGIGRGLVYLHEDSRLRVIHRDLKAGNILLDAEMNPKIADFGMARLFVLDQTEGETNRIVGTYGYMAPEYAMHGQFSVKSDVYSFGVLLLEIISGQKNSALCHGGDVNLLNCVWKSWKEGEKTSNLLDPTLKTGLTTEIMRCIHIGLLCVQPNIIERPTMASVVLMLTSNSPTLPVPSQPFSLIQPETPTKVIRSNPSQNNSVQKSVNKASFTELFPR